MVAAKRHPDARKPNASTEQLQRHHMPSNDENKRHTARTRFMELSCKSTITRVESIFRQHPTRFSVATREANLVPLRPMGSKRRADLAVLALCCGTRSGRPRYFRSEKDSPVAGHPRRTGAPKTRFRQSHESCAPTRDHGSIPPLGHFRCAHR